MYEITHLPSIIEAGVTGEKGMRRIQIDMRPWLVDMPDGVASMVLIRPGETSSNAYIAATTFTDGILTWSPALADLGEVEGYGQMEIWLEKTQNSSVVKRGKSAKVQTFIRQSIADETGPIPEAQESWLEQMTALKTQTVNAAASVDGVVEQAQEAAADAETAKEAAEAAASAAMSAAVAAPEIRNGTWWIFNTVTGVWVNTGVSATGPAGPAGSAGPKGDPGDDGVTPEIAVTDITGGHRVAITDGSGTETFDVMDGVKGDTGNTGATGATPNLTIGTVSTLNPDQSATATITGTAENPVLNMGIPRGQTGSVDSVYGTTIPVSESDSRNIKQVLDLKLESVPNMTGASSSAAGSAGLVPAPSSGDQDKVLKGDGSWGTVVTDPMTGATASTDGAAGLVPAPEAGDQDKVLTGGGTWETIPTMTGATALTDGAAGLAPAPLAGETGRFLRADGTWVVPAGSGDSQVGIYAIDATIPTSSWVAGTNDYSVTISDQTVTSTMTVLEWGITNESETTPLMLGETEVTVGAGTVTITTAVIPTASWTVHIDLGTDGSNVLEEVAGKAGQELLGYKENGNTASRTIADGSFVVWKGDLYKASAAIPQGTAFSSSNLTAVTSGGFNELQSGLNSAQSSISSLNNSFGYGSAIEDVNNQTIRMALCNSSTLNTPYKAGLTSSNIGLCIHSAAGNFGQQIYMSHGENRVFIRYKASGTWGSWDILDTTTKAENISSTVTASSGITTRVLTVTKSGHTVMYKLQFDNSTARQNGTAIYTNVPDRYRPQGDVWGFVQSSTSTPCMLYLSSGGSIIVAGSGLPVGTWYTGTIFAIV